MLFKNIEFVALFSYLTICQFRRKQQMIQVDTGREDEGVVKSLPIALF